MRILTGQDTVAGSDSTDYTGKVLVVAVEGLTDKYQHGQFQLWRASGGFGCDPTAIGRAVFCENLFDGEKTRFNRADFLGEAKPEVVAEYEEWKQEHEALKSRKSDEMYAALGGLLPPGTDLELSLEAVKILLQEVLTHRKDTVPEDINGNQAFSTALDIVTGMKKNLDFDKIKV